MERPNLWLTIFCGLAVIFIGSLIIMFTTPTKEDIDEEIEDNYHDNCKILDFKDN